MSGMFQSCDQLQDLTPLANWDISNVKNMQYMFLYCAQLNVYEAEDVSESSEASDEEEECVYDDTYNTKSYLRNLFEQDRASLLNALWERVKPLLKDTTKLNGYFKQYNHNEDLPSDWQGMEIPQWIP
jgi:surface protein